MIMQAITDAQGVYSNIVTADTTRRALVLSTYILNHKLALVDHPSSAEKNIDRPISKEDLIRNNAKVCKILTQEFVSSRSIYSRARTFSQQHTPEAGNAVLNALAENGFGVIEKTTRGKGYLKRKLYNELPAHAQALAGQFGVNIENYDKCAEVDGAKRWKNAS